MGIFKGRQQIPFYYSAWGYTRGNGKTWHGGIDVVGLDDSTIIMPTYKGKVISGTVITARIVSKLLGGSTWEWGYYVCVKLDTNQTNDAVNYLYFCHNEKNLVKVGAKVKSGDAIAIMGNTGNAALANPPIKHCHFEVRQTTSGRGLDPTAYTMTDNKVGIYGVSEQEVSKTMQPLSKESTTIKIGPASSGDKKQIQTFAVQLGLGYKEDSDGTIYVGPASAGDQITILTKASALNLKYEEYKPDTNAEKIASLEAQLKDMTAQRDQALAKADNYLKIIHNARSVLEV